MADFEDLGRVGAVATGRDQRLADELLFQDAGGLLDGELAGGERRAHLVAAPLDAILEDGRLTDTIAGLAKFNNTRKAREVIADARDMLGGNGVLLENHVIRHMGDIEIIHTYEGTATMQALIVGRDTSANFASSVAVHARPSSKARQTVARVPSASIRAQPASSSPSALIPPIMPWQQLGDRRIVRCLLSIHMTHLTIEPSILYVGTPVALLSTVNEDGTVNLAPMSSAWALGDANSISAAASPAAILLLRPVAPMRLPAAWLLGPAATCCVVALPR